MKIWSLDDLKQLRRFYGSKNDRQLAAFFACDVADIESKAVELALAKNKHRFKGNPMPRWNPSELTYLKLHYPDDSNVQIGKALGRSVKSVASKAHQLGLKKSAQRRIKMGIENRKLRRD